MIVPRWVLLPGCVLSVILPAELYAQTCRGRPGFSRANVVANVGAMVASDVRSLSAGATVGRERGPFGSLAIGYVVRNESETFHSEQTGRSIGASVGYALIADEEGRVEFCPTVGFSQVRVSGAFLGSTATLSQNAFRVGSSVGLKYSPKANLLLVPFLGVDNVWFGGSVKGDGIDIRVPEDKYTPVTVGVGAILDEWLGLNTALVIPLGVPTARNSFVTTVSIALGRL